MRTIRYAFFRGRGVISWAIRTFTRGEYSHVGVWFEDKTLYEAWQGSGKHLWRNSGVRRIPNWKPSGGIDIYKLEVTERQYEDAQRYAESQVGTGYDYRGVIRFVTKCKPPEDTNNFCSAYAFDIAKAARRYLLHAPAGEYINPNVLSYSPFLFLESSHNDKPIYEHKKTEAGILRA